MPVQVDQIQLHASLLLGPVAAVSELAAVGIRMVRPPGRTTPQELVGHQLQLRLRA